MKAQSHITYINFEMDDIETPFAFDIQDIELEVTYSIYGKNQTESFFATAEYKEIEIENMNVLKIMNGEEMFEPTDEQNDIILELIDKHEYNRMLKEMIIDEEERHAA